MSDDDPRIDPPQTGTEIEILRGFLTYHRDTFRMKTAGLSTTQLAVTLPPSPVTLGGMMKHLAVVESGWFSEVFVGGDLIPPFDTAPWDDDRDWEWHTAGADDPAELRGLYERSIAESQRITDEALAGPASDRPRCLLPDLGGIRPRPASGWARSHFRDAAGPDRGQAAGGWPGDQRSSAARMRAATAAGRWEIAR